MVKWLTENGARLKDDHLYSAATTGNVELCKWLKNNGCEMKTYGYCPGSLPLLQLLVEWGFVPGSQFFFNAASNGYFDQIKWAKSQGYKWDLSTCSAAAAAGRLDILQWVRERGCPWNELCCLNAARIGNMEILQWAVDNGCPLPSTTQFYTKNKSIYEYLINKGCTVDAVAIHDAASQGNMETVKWLLQYAPPMDEYDRKKICNMAAKYGDINMLQWTKENNYEWTEETINCAVENPTVFKWLRNNGCPWNSSTLEKIVSSSNIELLKWALKHECPVGFNICEVAAWYGEIEVMKVLLQFNCEPNIVARAAINASHNRLFYWLVKNGIVTKNLYKMAKGDKEVTEWLVRHNYPKE